MDKDIHRVRFNESKDVVGKENEIIIEKKDHSKLEVHLGFLQLNHRYKISFSIPRALCEIYRKSEVKSNNSTSLSSYLKIIDFHETNDTLNFQLELFAHKEHLMIEEFTFEQTGANGPVSLSLTARVLGKGKGTPLLKNGIHVISRPVEEDSDTSSDFPDHN